MPGGAFHPQAFDASAFSPQAFSSQNTAHGSSNRPDARRRRFPSREALRKRARRQTDEDLLLAVL